jgi:hypothetical protein
VRGSEEDAGYFMALCQCVPDGTKEEHKEAQLEKSVSVHIFKLKSP